FDLVNRAASEGLWDMSVVAGDPLNPDNVFWWSQTFRALLGFNDHSDFPDVLGSWAGRLHPDDRERVLDAFGAHLNDRSGMTPYDIEYRLQCKNGEYRWFRARGATLRDDKGVPLRVAGSLADIT
ncbi:PAS domain-containing protein, partial [Chromobacterium piscinae]